MRAVPAEPVATDSVSDTAYAWPATLRFSFDIVAEPEARVSLLPDALADAKARATKIAESSGARIGKLRSASQGVVQVIQANSTDVSDYGYYDTSTKEKEIMVTVKASFTVK
jgi:hypothetical protein